MTVNQNTYVPTESTLTRLLLSTNLKTLQPSGISVRAVDDFRVTGVQVEIDTASGALLEKGNAVQQVNGVDWTYTATQANNPLTGSKIKAIATDVPGNEGTLECVTWKLYHGRMQLPFFFRKLAGGFKGSAISLRLILCRPTPSIVSLKLS